MSLSARLKLEDHSNKDVGIKILSCSFSFSQDVDSNGMISSDVRPGLISITIPGINDTEIVQWMLGKDVRKNGEIQFSGVLDSALTKSLKFEDAVLVYYHESFSDQSDIVIQLSISCRKIIYSGGPEIETRWDLSGGED